MVETRTVVAVSAASAALAVTGYLIYFDYKRRNDPSFRKKLRKEKKKAAKNSKEDEAATSGASGRSQEELKKMVDEVKAEPLPTLPAEREKYFMDHVGRGEQMLSQGPGLEVPAALAFYRALRAYPSPMDIIVIFQNTLPPQIFAIVMELTSLDVSSSEAKEPEPISTSSIPPAPVSAPVPTPGSEPTSGPSAAPERTATPPPAPSSVQETESEHDSEVMVDADVETEIELEAESEAEGETKADAMSEAEIVSAAHSEPDTESQREVGTAPGVEDSTGTQEMSYAEVAAKVPDSESEVKAESHQEPPADSEATHAPEAALESEAKPESEPAAPRDPASVPLGSDSEDDARSETHSETDSYHQVAASQDGHSDWDNLAASQTSLPPQNNE